MRILERITDDFNNRLTGWQERFGCTANFSWGYDRAGRKQLAITEVDVQVYRKDAPSAQSLQSMLGRLEDQHIGAQDQTPAPDPAV